MQDRTPSPDTLDPIERASIDELRAVQLERLQASVRHAYDNVAHYRAAFDAAGARPDDVRELADLASLPFTTKADLRATYGAYMDRLRGTVGGVRATVDTEPDAGTAGDQP